MGLREKGLISSFWCMRVYKYEYEKYLCFGGFLLVPVPHSQSSLFLTYSSSIHRIYGESVNHRARSRRLL